jgi:hypothetical protein
MNIYPHFKEIMNLDLNSKHVRSGKKLLKKKLVGKKLLQKKKESGRSRPGFRLKRIRPKLMQPRGRRKRKQQLQPLQSVLKMIEKQRKTRVRRRRNPYRKMPLKRNSLPRQRQVIAAFLSDFVQGCIFTNLFFPFPI